MQFDDSGGHHNVTAANRFDELIDWNSELNHDKESQRRSWVNGKKIVKANEKNCGEQ